MLIQALSANLRVLCVSVLSFLFFLTSLLPCFHTASPPTPAACLPPEPWSPENSSARESPPGRRSPGSRLAAKLHWGQSAKPPAHPRRESESLFPAAFRRAPLE